MLIGYMRVSTADQSLDLQKDALERAGCEQIYSDKASGSRDDRPGLRDALSRLRKGDTLVIWKLDRLGRTTRGLMKLAEDLRDKEINFACITTGFDTGTPAGRFFFTIMAGMAEMEREIIRERTNAGLAAARARGRSGGRPGKLTARQIAHARRLLEDRETSIKEVAASLGVDRSTLYRAMNKTQPTLRP